MVRSMARGILLLTFVALALAPASAGAGGGGCHNQTTTDEAGTRVVLADNCFGPTVLRVARGQTVTWLNKDAVLHTVTAAGRMFDSELSTGKQAAYTFGREGVYTYFCYYHPSMVGTVVVGTSQAETTGAAVVPAANVTSGSDEGTSGSSTALVALVAAVGGFMAGNAPRIARRIRVKS